MDRPCRVVTLPLALFLMVIAPPRGAAIGLAEWLAYRAIYVAPEGRIIDTHNDGVSHSEGQGYGMLLALAFEDPETFDQIWEWTRTNLQVRDDHLLAWRWRPADDDGGEVDDLNNATDGDLLIAWALLVAGERWNRSDLTDAAVAILDDVATILIVETAFGKVLLPGAEGFQGTGSVIVNPSYWVYPALATFAEEIGDDPWGALVQSGLALLTAGRFGEWHLPPDWLEVGDELALPGDFAPVFGYNAIRIPLYLQWSELDDIEAQLEPFQAFWAGFDGKGPPPATVDLASGALDPDRLSIGGQAIAVLTRFGRSSPVSATAMMAELRPDDDYYSSTLLLLGKTALAKGRKL
jgi:endo-1,4-beta-D-glucanase Y